MRGNLGSVRPQAGNPAREPAAAGNMASFRKVRQQQGGEDGGCDLHHHHIPLHHLLLPGNSPAAGGTLQALPRVRFHAQVSFM